MHVRRRRRRTLAGRCSWRRACLCVGTIETQPRWTGRSGQGGELLRLCWLRMQLVHTRSS